MTQGGDHVEDTGDDEDQGPIMGIIQDSIAVGKTQRNSRKPSWFTTNMIMAYALSIIEEATPSTYREPEISSESKMWKNALMKEMNDTWELTELPKGKKAIGCKWVFVKKQGSLDGDTICYKAKLVAKSYANWEGIDYNEVFSPVVKHSSIRVLIALVEQYEFGA